MTTLNAELTTSSVGCTASSMHCTPLSATPYKVPQTEVNAAKPMEGRTSTTDRHRPAATANATFAIPRPRYRPSARNLQHEAVT